MVDVEEDDDDEQGESSQRSASRSRSASAMERDEEDEDEDDELSQEMMLSHREELSQDTEGDENQVRQVVEDRSKVRGITDLSA